MVVTMKIEITQEMAFDTEATGLSKWKGAKPYLFGFCNSLGDVETHSFPVHPLTRDVDYSKNPESYERIKSILEDDDVEKIIWNAKYDLRMSDAAGIKVRGTYHDAMIAMKVCRSDEMTYALKPLAKKYLDISSDDESELKKAITSLRTRAPRSRYNISPPEHAAADYFLVQFARDILVTGLKALKTYQKASSSQQERLIADAIRKAKVMAGLDSKYCGIDTERAMGMWLLLKDVMETDGLRHVYDEEMKLMPVVMAVEDRGLKLSVPWIEVGIEHTTALRDAEWKKITAVTGTGFNPNSPKQREEFFIEKQGLSPLNYTDAGNPQIDKTFFEHYKDEHPVCGAMVKFDRADTAIGFFQNYMEHMDAELVIHPGLDQIGAKTLRFSCREPNFQNVPKRGRCTHCGAELKILALRGFTVKCAKCRTWAPLDPLVCVRRPFGPRPGYVWLAKDYKQIEARIFADCAEEQVLLEAFIAGRDPYQELNGTVQNHTGLDIGRDIAKHIFLGKIYGIGVGTTVNTIRAMGGGTMGESEAKDIIQAFNDSCPRSLEYMNEVKQFARENGYVQNRYGQRVNIDPKVCYKGVNYIVQPEAARLMKRAMVKIHKWFKKNKDRGHLILTIHDELISEIPDDDRKYETAKVLCDIMEDNEGAYTVPTPVDASWISKTWLLKEEVKW